METYQWPAEEDTSLIDEKKEYFEIETKGNDAQHHVGNENNDENDDGVVIDPYLGLSVEKIQDPEVTMESLWKMI